MRLNGLGNRIGRDDGRRRGGRQDEQQCGDAGCRAHGRSVPLRGPVSTLSDETLPVLAELASLETLRLEEARLRLESLVRLKQLPQLKKLALEGIDLPEADVERLKSELSKVEIQWTKPNDTYMKRIQKLFGP